ncbi:MAG: hypothetical protein RBT38_02375 [Bacteroidales bacterium]|jgi:hypothetical protein|nr:hypothetical protein [Bacteroidales bacterium]
MKTLLDKLNYKGQKRIAVINSVEDFRLAQPGELKDVQIDSKIDQRYPYSFIMIFVKEVEEVEHVVPEALHNLVADGMLWFCFPKKSSEKYKSLLGRDHGWKALNDLGFYGVSVISLNEDWSGQRFRNLKYIKSVSGRYPAKK